MNVLSSIDFNYRKQLNHLRVNMEIPSRYLLLRTLQSADIFSKVIVIYF